MSDPLRIAADMLANYEQELRRTSVAYTPSMPPQIRAAHLERQHYAEGAVDVLRKVMAVADGQMETLG